MLSPIKVFRFGWAKVLLCLKYFQKPTLDVFKVGDVSM